MISVLETVGLALAAMHFSVPLAYYLYAKRKWLNKPWNIKRNSNYTPYISIIVPTYNEARFIERKLENIYEQEYPRDKLEVIVVDSASTDGTAEKVEAWAKRHNDIKIVLLREKERKGKAAALNLALRHAKGEIVIITDTDAWWPDKNTLAKVAEWLADPQVGAVSCLKKPAGKGVAGIEESYRTHYNILRLAESKAWATPIFHGELAAYRKHLLEEIGGFPTDIGADDSHTATRIAIQGYRSITPETIWCTEAVPENQDYHRWRIRRAQHLIQHFQKTLKLLSNTKTQTFKKIVLTEAYLHTVNPWLLVMATALLAAATAAGSTLAATTLLAGIVALAYRPYRTWLTSQLYLIAATIRNLYTKEIVWQKEQK